MSGPGEYAALKDENAALKARVEALERVVKQANCVYHWHDAPNGGMVVSAEAVHALWDILESTGLRKYETIGPEIIERKSND